jgi:hypothetical protein
MGRARSQLSTSSFKLTIANHVMAILHGTMPDVLFGGNRGEIGGLVHRPHLLRELAGKPGNIVALKPLSVPQLKCRLSMSRLAAARIWR